MRWDGLGEIGKGVLPARTTSVLKDRQASEKPLLTLIRGKVAWANRVSAAGNTPEGPTPRFQQKLV